MEDGQSNVDDFWSSGSLSYMGKYKKNLVARLKGFNEKCPVYRECQCEVPQPAVMSTCWEGMDIGRRVLKCHKHDLPGGCGYVRYIDGPLYGHPRYLADFMHDQIQQLVLENTILREKIGRYEGTSTSAVPETSLSAKKPSDEPLVYDEILIEFRPPNFRR